ncbi:hypothetical protein Scep_025547 [Stephania cephalantha]|uniref:GED domain-containing protein n=1 Tax=Stephania cephalantha TaxID=152367 RepID=A0AAP0HME4_9MAGN
MENLISLVNKLQRACTALGDHGEESALPTLWDSLPAIAVVGGQSSGKSSVLESIVGRDFLPRGSGNLWERGLTFSIGNYVAAVRKEISDETDRETGRTKQISTPNCIILAISPANQDLATSDAIKISRDVDPKGERTFGVLTKIDLMDKGTDAVDILEGKSYRLQFPWIGVVNRSQADINKSVDMINARQREREYFANTPEYKHLAHRMGSEHLGIMLSKHLETVIKSRIPGLQSLISKSILELEMELDRLGKPIATDAGHLSMENVRKLISEADGYQPHLIAPEQGYRRLIESTIVSIKGPAEAAVDAVHSILKELVHKAISETADLKLYPTLRVDVGNAACESLDKMRDESKKATLKLVDMECGYLTVEFFRKLPQDVEKGGNPTHSIFDRYNDSYLRRVGTTVLSYVNMVCEGLRNSIPKSIVYCQVREAKRSLLDHFFTELARMEQKQLSAMLNEDPAVMERRVALSKRLELYKSAEAEISSAAWSK